MRCPQLAGLAVMAVGIWTLALKSDYISLLASGTYLATAYILVVAGVVVMVTGVLGCCATFKERRNLLRLVSRAPGCCWGGWGAGSGAPVKKGMVGVECDAAGQPLRCSPVPGAGGIPASQLGQPRGTVRECQHPPTAMSPLWPLGI